MNNPLRALAYLLAAILLVECAGVCAKLVSAHVSLYSIVFSRSFFALFPLLLGIWLMGGRKLLTTPQPKTHLLRGLTGFFTVLANFYAIKHLPLATVTAIQFTMPFWMMLLASFYLQERLTPARWLAVIVGFGGALLVVEPWQGTTLHPAVFAALASAFLGACNGAFARQLTQTDHSLTIALSFSLIGTVFGLCLLPIGFIWPAPAHMALLAAVGLAGGVAQLLLVQAFRYGPVSVIAPFEYTALLWATLFGWIFWGHLPGLMTLYGAILIVAADLLVLVQGKIKRDVVAMEKPAPT